MLVISVVALTVVVGRCSRDKYFRGGIWYLIRCAIVAMGESGHGGCGGSAERTNSTSTGSGADGSGRNSGVSGVGGGGTGGSGGEGYSGDSDHSYGDFAHACLNRIPNEMCGHGSGLRIDRRHIKIGITHTE